MRTKIAVAGYNCANPRSLTVSLPFPSNIHNTVVDLCYRSQRKEYHFFSITEERMQPRSSPPSYIFLWFQLTNLKFSFPDSYFSISISVGVLVGLGLVAVGLLVHFLRSKPDKSNNPLPQGLYIVNSFHVKLKQTTRLWASQSLHFIQVSTLLGLQHHSSPRRQFHFSPQWKLKGAQSSEPVKKVKFSSRPRAKGRSQGPLLKIWTTLEWLGPLSSLLTLLLWKRLQAIT